MRRIALSGPVPGHIPAAAVVLFCVAVAALAPPASAQNKANMGRKLPEINLNNIPLNDAIDFIRDVSGLNIHVDWKSLESVNVAKDTPVTLKVRDVTIRRALTLILNEASREA